MANKLENRLHPEAKSVLAYLQKIGAKPYYEFASAQAVRDAYAIIYEPLHGTCDGFAGKVDDIRIPSPDVTDGIPVYVYTPDDMPQDPAIWIYFHGGGMVLGNREMQDTACRYISMLAKCIVVNVEYRLAPEYKYPAFIEDSVCVAKWVLQNKIKLGGSEPSKVGVGGDSAGGTISASICHDVPGLQFQALIYPHVGSPGQLDSHKEFGEAPGLNDKMIDWFLSQTFEDKADADSARLRSFHRDRFDHLPTTLFVVAEIDPLRDESYVYQEKLEAAGVTTELVLIKGALHGFFNKYGFYKECCKQCYESIARFIQRVQQS